MNFLANIAAMDGVRSDRILRQEDICAVFRTNTQVVGADCCSCSQTCSDVSDDQTGERRYFNSEFQRECDGALVFHFRELGLCVKFDLLKRHLGIIHNAARKCLFKCEIKLSADIHSQVEICRNLQCTAVVERNLEQMMPCCLCNEHIRRGGVQLVRSRVCRISLRNRSC